MKARAMDETNPATVLVWLLLVGLLVPVLKSVIFIVRGKNAAILETFGKPHAAARMPGLNFKFPWPITAVVGKVDLQLQEMRHDVDVKTRDNAFMKLPVTIQYQASNDPHATVKAFYELEDPAAQITSYVLNVVRQSAAAMDMEELYSSTSDIEEAVEIRLGERFTGYGYRIANVLVDEPQPSPEVRTAFNRVIASKRLKEAAQNEADAERIKLVETARAQSESKKLQGEGIAAMRKAIADGLKEQVATIRAAGLTGPEAIAFLNETNRLDTLNSVAGHGNVFFLDVGAHAQQVANLAMALEAVRPDHQPTTPVTAPATKPAPQLWQTDQPKP